MPRYHFIFVSIFTIGLTIFILHTTKANSDKPLERITFGADFDQEKPQPLWNTLLNFNPELFLFLGDNVYADTENTSVMRKAYEKLAAVPGYQILKRKNIPVMATWDDHDFGVDNGDASFPIKTQSQKIFLDFFDEPEDSPRRLQKGIYHSQMIGPPGKTVQIIALDTRFFKTDSTLLGDDQWKWLKNELKKTAEIRLIMSSIQVISTDTEAENWGRHQNEKKKLFELIKTTKTNGVLFLSGDRHFAELSAINPGVGYPLYEITTGSFNKKQKKISSAKNPYRLKEIEHSENFGLIKIDWGLINPPSITLEIKTLDGSSVLQRKIPFELLKQGILPY